MSAENQLTPMMAHTSVRGRLYLLALFVVFYSGCASVSITPKELTRGKDRMDERNSDLKQWTNAVSLCSEFLSSPERKTLPFGHIYICDEGMEFVSDTNRQPINVRWTSWGDLLIPFDMIAQERSDGFVVGLAPPGKKRLLDNSFFKTIQGTPNNSAEMASLILHELTHSYYHMGTVDVYHGFTYYLEAIFLLRYQNHSQERVPFQTDAEFETFIERKRAQQSR
jgi:hypothetical protein